MFSCIKIALPGFFVGVGGLLAGCQSAESPPSHVMSAQAVHCDKCEVTWVKTAMYNADFGPDTIAGYSTRKEMTCPDCRNAVSNFFATGKLEHHCNACAGNMVPCDKH